LKRSVVSVVIAHTASASTARSAQLDGSERLRRHGMLCSSTITPETVSSQPT
jgi:hypothetical protein